MGDGTLRTGRFSDRRRSRQRSGRVPDRSRDGHRPPHTARHGATLRDRIGHDVPLEPPTRSTISATTSVSNSDETLDLARPLDVPAGVTRDKGAYRLADLQRTRAPLRNDDHPPTRRMLLDGNWQSISPLRWPRVRASLVCERHRRTAGSREPELRRPDTLRVLSLLPFYPLVQGDRTTARRQGTYDQVAALANYQKLGAATRSDAVALAVDAGLIERFWPGRSAQTAASVDIHKVMTREEGESMSSTASLSLRSTPLRPQSSRHICQRDRMTRASDGA